MKSQGPKKTALFAKNLVPFLEMSTL